MTMHAHLRTYLRKRPIGKHVNLSRLILEYEVFCHEQRVALRDVAGNHDRLPFVLARIVQQIIHWRSCEAIMGAVSLLPKSNWQLFPRCWFLEILRSN